MRSPPGTEATVVTAGRDGRKTADWTGAHRAIAPTTRVSVNRSAVPPHDGGVMFIVRFTRWMAAFASWNGYRVASRRSSTKPALVPGN